MATSGVFPSLVPSTARGPLPEPPLCIFLIYNIPIDVDDDFDVVVPLLPDQLDQIADAHLLPLKTILDTPLNYSGKVQTIYINFGWRGLYELHKPRAYLLRDMTPGQFKTLLREMFQNGRVLQPQTIEELACRIPNMNTLLAALPQNCHKIGVLTGPNPVDITVSNLLDVVNSINDENLLFVVGDFVGSEIESYLQKIVKVSEYELTAATCLTDIVNAVAHKWNIH